MSSGGRLRDLLTRRARDEVDTDPERVVVAPVRLGKKTKDLVKRLELGEIAVIDHADLDRIAAEDLALSGISAVINVSRFSTDRYPNIGPLRIARAGIVLIEADGAPLFETLSNGDVIELDGGDVLMSGQRIAEGVRPSLED